MPTSLPSNIPYVLSIIGKIMFSKIDKKLLLEYYKRLEAGKPRFLPEKFKILDVGIGFGKWGFLIRDLFDVLNAQNFSKSDWKIDITGVEVFPKYITPIQKIIYNKIIKKNISEALDELENYDLIIMGDIIEHFEKKDSHELLRNLFRCSENIIVSTPFDYKPQGGYAGNKYEIHKSGWTLSDFKNYRIVEYKIITDIYSKMLLEVIPNSEKKEATKSLIVWIKK